jgi:hypothetical protein
MAYAARAALIAGYQHCTLREIVFDGNFILMVDFQTGL